MTRVADMATGGPQAHAQYRYRIQSRNRKARAKGSAREQRKPQEGRCFATRRARKPQASDSGAGSHGQATRQEPGRESWPVSTCRAQRGSGIRFGRTSLSREGNGREPTAPWLVRGGLRPARRRDGSIHLRLGVRQGEAEAASAGGDRRVARHRQARSRCQAGGPERPVAPLALPPGPLPATTARSPMAPFGPSRAGGAPVCIRARIDRCRASRKLELGASMNPSFNDVLSAIRAGRPASCVARNASSAIATRASHRSFPLEP